MIRFIDTTDGIAPDQLDGFFVGWPNPPTNEVFLRILNGSDRIVLAVDDAAGRVVGFMTAISDGELSVYFPLLEVLPDCQKRGIGTELVRRMVVEYGSFYMLDLLCDSALVPFYERCGFRPSNAMCIRRLEHQSGATACSTR